MANEPNPTAPLSQNQSPDRQYQTPGSTRQRQGGNPSRDQANDVAPRRPARSDSADEADPVDENMSPNQHDGVDGFEESNDRPQDR